MKTKLQTVLDALKLLGRAANLSHDSSSVESEAIAIIDELLAMEPVAMLRTEGIVRTFPLDEAYELPAGHYTLYAFKEVLK
jgi:hypothetical protein